MEVCKECFFKGVSILKEGVRLGDLGSVIQRHAEDNGFSVVRELVGHGIGRTVHEEPNVPNYGVAGRGMRLEKNMTIAIEPMINAGTRFVSTDSNGWTVRTKDGKLSAHFDKQASTNKPTQSQSPLSAFSYLACVPHTCPTLVHIYKQALLNIQ